MTFEEYIINPTHSRVFANMRESYRIMYTEKFNAVMVRENGKIEYKLYTLKDRYFIYLKIPSEVVADFYYDVLVEFYPNVKTVDTFRSLDKYQVRFFSNDPSFVYTFAYAFKKNKMFVDELDSKMGKIALKTKPKETNPKEEVGYVKSLYFTYLFIKNRGLLDKGRFKAEATKLDFKQLSNIIMDADQKIELRQTAGNNLHKKKSETESTTTSNRFNISQKLPDTKNIKHSKIVPRTSTSKYTKTSKIIKRK